MKDDLGEYVEYSFTVNGEKFSLTARGWYYTHAVVFYEDGKWHADSWHGAKIGEPSGGLERATRAVEKVRHTSAWKDHFVATVGKDYRK